MQEGTKKTVIWETNSEPPRNYIWIKSDGTAYEYDWDIREWVPSRNIASGGTSVITKTTAEWNDDPGYVPANGEIIVYSDRRSYVKDGQTIYVPGIKVGNGNDIVRNLAFIDDGSAQIDIEDHINDNERHINVGERDFWNNKVSIDASELNSETLIFKTN